MASVIPGPNVTPFGLSAGEGEGSGYGWDGPSCYEQDWGGWGADVRTVDQGRRCRTQKWVPSDRQWVEGRLLECAKLGVQAEELIVLLGWGSSSTILLDTRVLGKSDLPVNCHFSSTFDRQLELTLEVKPREAWGLWGEDGLTPLGCRYPFNSPLSTLSSPEIVVATSGGVGACRTPRANTSSYR